MPVTKPESVPPRFLAIQWGIAVICSLLTAAVVLFAGGVPQQPEGLAFSVPRLLVTAVPFLACAAAVLLLLRALTGRSHADRLAAWILRPAARAGFVLPLAWSSIVIGLLALCLPAYHFGELADYYVRVRPLVIWVGTLGLQILVLLWYPRRAEIRRCLQHSVRESGAVWRTSAWTLVGLVVLWILMVAVVRGVSTYEDYQYEAGVPILTLQVAASVLAGILFRRIVEPRFAQHASWMDRWAFVLVWLLAALYWARMPTPSSYMNPAPRPPNFEIYPYSDSAEYDLQSQSALLGQGMNYGRALDNPMYPAFLAIVHLLSGQDFKANMAVQGAVLAILPAIAYLLGKQLRNRALGITAAFMIAFQGGNSIAAAAVINSASPKQMLTDFPTAIGIALVMLTAVNLVQRRDGFSMPAIWHGGSVGLTFLIRPTGMVMLGVAPILAVLQKGSSKRWLRILLLTGAAFVLFLTPWGLRNELRNQDAIAVYLSKIGLVNRTRFRDLERKADTNPPVPAHEQSLPADGSGPDRSLAPRTVLIPLVVLKHLANNVMGSILILPTSPVLDDLQHTLRAPTSVWTRSWDGSLGFGQILGLLLSAAFLAIGGAVLWRSTGLAAVVPLVVFVLYQVGNSLGRTSGGRYLVPVDWLVLLYYSAGLLAVCEIGAQIPQLRSPAPIMRRSPGSRGMAAALLCIVVLGAGPVLVDVAFPARYPQGETTSSLGKLRAQNALLHAGYSLAEIDGFLSSWKGVSLMGQAMYPRWFSYRAIAKEAEGSLTGLGFPHLEFYLIGPQQGARVISLFASSPVELANVADVLVIGCRESLSGRVDALAIVEAETITTMNSGASLPSLKCPQALPVCDNNGNCQ